MVNAIEVTDNVKIFLLVYVGGVPAMFWDAPAKCEPVTVIHRGL